MEMWFSELHTTNVKLSMRIERQLCSVESDCQRIDVLVSDEFGKFLALDGEILFSEYMMRWLHMYLWLFIQLLRMFL